MRYSAAANTHFAIVQNFVHQSQHLLIGFLVNPSKTNQLLQVTADLFKQPIEWTQFSNAQFFFLLPYGSFSFWFCHLSHFNNEHGELLRPTGVETSLSIRYERLVIPTTAARNAGVHWGMAVSKKRLANSAGTQDPIRPGGVYGEPHMSGPYPFHHSRCGGGLSSGGIIFSRQRRGRRRQCLRQSSQLQYELFFSARRSATLRICLRTTRPSHSFLVDRSFYSFCW